MIKSRIFFLMLTAFLITGCIKIKKNIDIKNQVSEYKTESCVISYLAGNGSIVDEAGNKIMNLTTGLNLNEKDILTTETGCTVELQIGGNSSIRIKENSRIRVASLFEKDQITAIKFNLESGKILAKPETLSPGSTFEIQTRSVTAGVRGTEFVVYVPDENNVIIAVNKGSVSIRKNIKLNNIDNIKNINPEFADKIINSVNPEIVLEKNESTVIKSSEVDLFINEANTRVALLSEQIEQNKNSQEKVKDIIDKAEKSTLNELKIRSEKTIPKKNVTESDWNKKYNQKEFDEMISGIENEKSSEAEEKTEPGINKTENDKKNKLKQKPDKKVNDKEKNKISETKQVNQKEDQKEPVTLIEKLPISLKSVLAEKSSSVTANGRFIFTANDIDKTICCINPADGSVLWKFTNEKLTKIQSSPLSGKSNVVLATYTDIFILDSSGKLVQDKVISNGPSFWANPIIFGNMYLIPTARTIFSFDGVNVQPIDEKAFPAANSQLYLSGDQANIFIVDSLNKIIKAFDFTKNEIIWTSDKLNNIIFCPVLKTEKYLYAGDISSNLYRFNFAAKQTAPDILNVNTGIISELINYGEMIFFVGKDGWFYRVNGSTFNSYVRIIQVDQKPEQDKYLIKKPVRYKNFIYFCSDSGALFEYDINNGKTGFLKSSDVPLVGSPVVINGNVYFYDTQSNLYLKKTVNQ